MVGSSLDVGRRDGDAIIIGASNLKQLQQNLATFNKGPLSEEIVAAFDEAWKISNPTRRNTLPCLREGSMINQELFYMELRRAGVEFFAVSLTPI